MRITSKGQVTIPQAIRERAGLLPNTEVEFLVDGDVVLLVKAVKARRPTRGARAIAALESAASLVPIVHRRVDGVGARRAVTSVLVDTNVLIDVITGDRTWGSWSRAALDDAHDSAIVVINPIIYGEVSAGFAAIEAVDVALPKALYRREPVPYAAAFLASRAFVDYRRRGGTRPSPLADFFIGAHAAVAGYRLLTRDPARYRTSFPRLS